MPSITFSDFTGGEFAQLGPTGCKPNQFTGTNVMVYQDGSIGPRPGVKQVAVTSTVVGSVWAFRGLGAAPGVTDFQYLFGQGQRVRKFTDTLSSGITTVGTVSITATVTTQIIQNGPLTGYIPLYGAGVYQVSSTTVTALTASPGARVGAPFGVRLLVGNTIANPNRIYYSAAADPTSWPALNFFDIGLAAWPNTYMDEIRQRMSIANQGGEWWSESGVPGVNDVLRRLPRGDLGPLQWYHAVRMGEVVWFLPAGDDFPVQFTGSTVNGLALDYLRFTNGTGTDYFLSALPVPQVVTAFEVGGSNRGLIMSHGTWSYHQFGVTTRFATPGSIGGTSADYDRPMLLTDGGSASAAPSFYTFAPALDRPGKVGDSYAQPGDMSTTPLVASMAIPYHWASRYYHATSIATDSDLTVQEVTLDGFTWNTGSSATNHCDVQVRSLFRYGTANNPTAYKDSTAQSFDQPTASTPADRTDVRVRLRFGDQQPAQGFQIRLSNMRGFAVRRIRVSYTETGRR